jgi:hypothetical protein
MTITSPFLAWRRRGVIAIEVDQSGDILASRDAINARAKRADDGSYFAG